MTVSHDVNQDILIQLSVEQNNVDDKIKQNIVTLYVTFNHHTVRLPVSSLEDGTT